MDVESLDLEGNAVVNQTNGNGNSNSNNTTVTDASTALDGTKDVDDINSKTVVSPVEGNGTNSTTEDGNGTTNEGNGEGNDSSTGELNSGDQLEIDGVTYTVAENGDIVDDKGNVFKEAKDVKDWLKTVNTEEDDDEPLNINKIQEALGVSVIDEEGKPVEFTNDTEGVKSYIDSVIELKSRDLQEAAVNKLFADNPLLQQFIDYVQVTGTYRGFGDVPDRSGIELDKDNEQQLEYVIRMAAQEFGNKSLNDKYIKYLKDSGGLYDEAKNQLQALVEKDKAYQEDVRNRAEAARKQEQLELTEYWNNVSKVIDSRNIAGYKIPDTFIKEIDGKKVTLTPNDFYDYLSRQVSVDANGNTLTGYQRDLSQLKDEELLNRELLDAWLMFTGGSYKDLVDMAIKEEKVKKLKIKSNAQRTARTVKIIKPQSGKVDINDIVL